ncbi:hypothetical protein DFH07DRAFT_777167 [Mycena maculata]|uniref:Uncharacterized protein n=1 Tax=Mycena maculata TaxID=230809 RepID=A0AAD7IIR7_9AGAR|nr:hypothetical protein DFH07DRAFT_777167 [Mycena maculata]
MNAYAQAKSGNILTAIEQIAGISGRSGSNRGDHETRRRLAEPRRRLIKHGNLRISGCEIRALLSFHLLTSSSSLWLRDQTDTGSTEAFSNPDMSSSLQDPSCSYDTDNLFRGSVSPDLPVILGILSSKDGSGDANSFSTSLLHVVFIVLKSAITHTTFECPARDNVGEALVAEPQELAGTIGCDYNDGETCIYFNLDGSLMAGPTACPSLAVVEEMETVILFATCPVSSFYARPSLTTSKSVSLPSSTIQTPPPSLATSPPKQITSLSFTAASRPSSRLVSSCTHRWHSMDAPHCHQVINRGIPAHIWHISASYYPNCRDTEAVAKFKSNAYHECELPAGQYEYTHGKTREYSYSRIRVPVPWYLHDFRAIIPLYNINERAGCHLRKHFIGLRGAIDKCEWDPEEVVSKSTAVAKGLARAKGLGKWP